MRAALLLCALLSGCALDNPPRSLAEPDRDDFDRAVHPILARRCAFSDCHGTRRRFFAVYARDRHRVVLPDGTGPTISAPITRLELDLSYERARGFVDAADPAESLILSKPLAESAGGRYHRAADQYGTGLDVFLDADDPEYGVLMRWAAGVPACPDGCEVPSSEVPK